MEGAGSTPKDAAGLAKYGLDKPVARITLGTGSARATLALGKEEEGAVYAQDQGRGMVFTVDPTFVSDLKKPADDYRDKEMFESASSTLPSVRVVRGAETLEFRRAPALARTPGRSGSAWWTASPPTSTWPRWTTSCRN